MTNTTATISSHPSDENILMLRTPHDHAAEMGRFEPARYDSTSRAYLVHVDHLEPLRRFAKRIGMYLVDQRAQAEGERTLMPECRNCGQPAKLGHEPIRCPDCGEVWSSRFMDGLDNRRGLTQTCPIGHTQLGAFPYCGTCGARIPPPEKTGPPVVLRQQLADPKPLAEVVVETVDLLYDAAVVEVPSDQ